MLVEGFQDIIDNNLVLGDIPYYLEKFYQIFKINVTDVGYDIRLYTTAYKEIYDLLIHKKPCGDDLQVIAQGVKKLFGNIKVKMFFWDQNEAIIYDGFYLLDGQQDINFYAKDNLKRLEKTLDVEPVLNTLYYNEYMCVIKIATEEVGDDSRALYFSFEYDKEKKNENWFRVKILLCLRNQFVYMLKNLNVLNEINKLDMKRKKTALEIKKAHAHYSKEHYEGRAVFSSYRQLISYQQNSEYTSVSDMYEISKVLYDNYILLLSNEFIADLYRKAVFYPCITYYKGIDLSERLVECLKEAGFEKESEESNNMIYTIFTPNKQPRNIAVKITCMADSFLNKKFWYFCRGEELIPAYYFLIMSFAANAGYHYMGADNTICNLVVKAEDNYIVIKNNISDIQLSEEEQEIIRKNAESKIQSPPWEFEGDWQSITLWSLFRYFQMFNVELNKLQKCKTRKQYPQITDIERCINVKVEASQFIVKLQMLETMQENIENEK